MNTPEATTDSNALVDFFYYKNTPLQKEMFAAMRDFFWDFIKKLIVLFNK